MTDYPSICWYSTMAVQRTCNAQVVGSTPTTSSITPGQQKEKYPYSEWGNWEFVENKVGNIYNNLIQKEGK